MMATAVSNVLVGTKVPREATVAQTLRKSGAILLGKTNLSEWANFRSSWKNSSNGWSGRGGQTWGVYYPGTDAEESSSGSAVSTILGLAFAVIGTETDGSMVKPAQRSNVVAIRPIIGLLPRDGVVPISLRQDTVGPIARTVKCAAQTLSAMAGEGVYDNATDSIPFEDAPDYSLACQSTKLDGLRIGIARNAMNGISDEVMAAFENALEVLKTAGVTIVDNVQLANVQDWSDWPADQRRMCLQAEFKVGIEKWCGQLTANPKEILTLTDIIDLTKSIPEEEYPARDMIRWIWAEEGPEV